MNTPSTTLNPSPSRTVTYYLALALLVAVALLATPTLAQEPEVEVNNTETLKVSRPTTEASPPGFSARVLREQSHPLADTGVVAGTMPTTVSVRDLEPAPVDRGNTPPEAHIQGTIAWSDALINTVAQLKSNSGSNIESSVPSTAEATAGTTVISNFEAIDSTGRIPPDIVVAVGENDILQAANRGFAIYSKLGREIQGYTTFSSFFGTLVPTGTGPFDPRVLYNPNKDQYVMLALGKDPITQDSWVFIAISQTSSADGSWWTWRVDIDSFPSDDSDAWMDYASLGADDWGIYITGNMFFWPGGFKRTKLVSLNPAMWTGGGANGWFFDDLEWPGGAQASSLQVADPHTTAGGAETFFVNSHVSTGSSVVLWTLTGDRTNAPTLSSVEITGVPTYYKLGESVNQPGSTTPIDGGDSRIMNAKYANRRVFFTLGSDRNNDGTRGSWVTAKLNVDNADVEWSDNLSGTNNYYTYPAITLEGTSPNGNLAVFGTWTSDLGSVDKFPTALYKIYDNQPTDDGGTFAPFRTGVASYVVPDIGGKNRWGDYSGADYDWTCGHLVGTSEFVDSLNSWSTQILVRKFGNEASCPLIDITSPVNGNVLSGGVNTTITWDKENLPGGSSIVVHYSDDGGTTWTQIATLPVSASSFTWKPEVFGSSSDGKVSVGSWNGSSYDARDESDGSFTVAGCADDFFEEDDTCNSRIVGLVTNEFHKACDVDWLSFTPVVGATYAISTSGLLGSSDTNLSLRRQCGSQLAFDDDGGPGAASLLSYTVDQPGRLDITVGQFDESYAAPNGYSISIACTACCDGSCSTSMIFSDGFESGTTSAWN